MEVWINSLNNTRHPRIRVKSNKKSKVIHSNIWKTYESKHKTNLKPNVSDATDTEDKKPVI